MNFKFVSANPHESQQSTFLFCPHRTHYFWPTKHFFNFICHQLMSFAGTKHLNLNLLNPDLKKEYLKNKENVRTCLFKAICR